jgi:hypothetical protein
VREYDIFVPLYYNDGSPIEARKYEDLQSALLTHFRGLTYFPQPNQGFWRVGDVTYRDEIVIYRVIASNERVARKFLRRLKVQLKRDFHQEEILIIERDVSTL